MSSTIIDDADQAIVYSGKWYAETGFANAYDGTMHVSSTLNDKAVLTFQGMLTSTAQTRLYYIF